MQVCVCCKLLDKMFCFCLLVAKACLKFWLHIKCDLRFKKTQNQHGTLVFFPRISVRNEKVKKQTQTHKFLHLQDVKSFITSWLHEQTQRNNMLFQPPPCPPLYSKDVSCKHTTAIQQHISLYHQLQLRHVPTYFMNKNYYTKYLNPEMQSRCSLWTTDQLQVYYFHTGNAAPHMMGHSE